MNDSTSFSRDPFHAHRMETNLHLSNLEEVKKFIPQKGKNRLGNLSNWFKAEKNRITHYAKHKIWINHKTVKKQIAEYKNFADLKINNKDTEDGEYLKQTAGKIAAFAGLFKGTGIEDEANELIEKAHQIAEPATESLKSLKDTISYLSKTLDEEELKPQSPSQMKMEQDLLHEIRTNKKFHKNIVKLKRSLDKNTPEAQTLTFLLEKAHLQNKLAEIKLNPSLVDQDFKAVKLLFSTRLIYNIVGFQNTTAAGKVLHEIKQTPEGKIMIRKQDQWVEFSKILDEFEIDKDTPLRGLVEKKKAGETEETDRQRWNYFSPHGLIPVDRYKDPQLQPVEQLSPDEMSSLLAHAQTFDPEGKVDPQKTCVIQVFTNPATLSKHDDNFFLTRLSASLPVHAGIRMIDADGKVYSTGLSGLPEEQQLREGKRNIMMTINSAPAILDFTEFQRHDGSIVTSIPITPEVFKENMDKLNAYRQQTVRFNIAKQNCVYLAQELLQNAGHDPKPDLSAGELFSGILPSVNNVTLIGKPLKKVDRKVNEVREKVIGIMPKPIKKAKAISHKVVWFIPSMITKLAIKNAGGGRGTPKKHDLGSQGLDNANEMSNFSHLLPKEEIFDNQSLNLKYSLPLIQWQLKQKSTKVQTYEGAPKMGVLPPTDEKFVEEGEAKKKKFVKKFLTNFNLE